MAGKEKRVEKRKLEEQTKVHKDWSKNFSVRSEYDVKLKRMEAEKVVESDTLQSSLAEQRHHQMPDKSNQKQKENNHEPELDGRQKSNLDQKRERVSVSIPERSDRFHEIKARELRENERIILGKNDGGLKDVLERIPSGRAALKNQEKYAPKLIRNGDGSFYTSHSIAFQGRKLEANSIYLGPKPRVERLALTYIHEMNHVEYFHEGKRANIDKLSRADYIDGKIDEEVKGTMASILAKKEMYDAGVNIQGVSFPLEEVYWNEYHSTIERARFNSKTSYSEQELQELGQKAGEARVKQGFYDKSDGITASGTGGKSYAEVHGKEWDDYHVQKKRNNGN